MQMKTTITIELNSGWVLSHRDDDVLPVAFLVGAIKSIFTDGIEVKGSTLTDIDLTVDESVVKAEEVREKIEAILTERYTAEELAGNFTITAAESEEARPVEFVKPDQAEKEEPKKEEQEESAEEKPSFSLPFLSFGEQASAQEKGEEAVAKVLAAIDETVGADEFKAIAHEVVQVAPEIIRNKTFDTFTYQSYIFAINDGYGLSDYLAKFAELVSALDIKHIAVSRPVIVHEIPLKKDGGADPFADAVQTLNDGRRDAVRILCLDISEWMSATEAKQFKDFLRLVESKLSSFIVVFRIPFVDKEVLDRLRFSLNDLMYVRTVTFPPFTQEEIQICAERTLEKYGFHMSRSAWDAFHQRITEEKSDGRFYGVNTVEKVVYELLYKKQLSNAKRKKNDFCIGKRDAVALCGTQITSALSGYEMLDRLVGNEPLKARVDEIVTQIELALKSDMLEPPCIHMRFVGNPGTGKTTVARILGKILKERGVLRIGAFYEYSGRDFCGRYVGETAPKTAGMCRDAYGSVLFIDEAYSLYRDGASSNDYGREALDTLIAEMENHRSDFVVIMAGYTDEMEMLMNGNQGLASRMPYVIEFPNFTREQLFEIYRSMVETKFKYEPNLMDAAREYFLNLPEDFVSSKAFSNGRFVRNLFERTWAKAAMRCQLEKKSTVVLTKDDFERSASEKEFALINQKKPTRLGF